MKTIGENITALRKENHLTQEQLAEKMNVTSQAVSKWENGLSFPDVETVARLSELFGCTTDKIITGKSPVCVSPADPPGSLSNRVVHFHFVEYDDDPEDNEYTDIRIPAEVFIKMQDQGWLDSLFGRKIQENRIGKFFDPSEPVIQLLKEGVVGSVIDIKNDDSALTVTIEEYEG